MKRVSVLEYHLIRAQVSPRMLEFLSVAAHPAVIPGKWFHHSEYNAPQLCKNKAKQYSVYANFVNILHYTNGVINSSHHCG